MAAGATPPAALPSEQAMVSFSSGPNTQEASIHLRRGPPQAEATDAHRKAMKDVANAAAREARRLQLQGRIPAHLCERASNTPSTSGLQETEL